MNREIETVLVGLLKELKNKYHASGVKLEFEAEGMRFEEAVRLRLISQEAGLPLAIKIGGCEAVRDLYDCKILGAKRIVAPMIESRYALEKFVNAFYMAYPANDRFDLEFYINIETATGAVSFPEMLKSYFMSSLSGIVIGRSDLSASCDLAGQQESKEILELASEIAAQAVAKQKKITVGGGVSFHSLAFLQQLDRRAKVHHFETRKIIFSAPEALYNPVEAFERALDFEIIWLKYKKQFYKHLSHQDDLRVIELEKRYGPRKKIADDFPEMGF